MAPSSFRVSEPGRGQPTADPGGGGIDGGGGGEKSRRHRPMVQSSRGWDAAPHSGWGVKPSAPSKGKGAKPPRGVPPGTAFRNGFGAASPLPSPRAASPLRPPSGSHAPPVARTSPPLPALVGPGRQLGARRAAAAAVGRALGVRRAVFPGPGREGVGWGVQLRPRGCAGSWPAPWRAPWEGAPCFVLRGLAATCH